MLSQCAHKTEAHMRRVLPLVLLLAACAGVPYHKFLYRLNKQRKGEV